MEAIAFARGAGDTLDATAMTAILVHGDQVVTLAGMFGHGALDIAARSLCDLTDGLSRAGMGDRAPIAVHVQTMHLLAPGAMTLTPEHAERMLNELSKVTAHFHFGSLSDATGHDAFIAATAS